MGGISTFVCKAFILSLIQKHVHFINTFFFIRYIGAVMRAVETNRKETDLVLTQAFQDLQGLMDKAAEMVALAETISNRLAKSNTMNNEETATFKTYLLSMGIAAPVTK